MIALEYISHGLKQKYSGYCGTVLFLMGCTAYFFVVTGLNHYTSFEGALGIGYGVVLYVYCLLAAEGRKSDFFLLSVVWVLLAFISAYVSGVDSLDMGNLIHNLLKNGIEACDQVKGERELEIVIGRDGCMVEIDIDNTIQDSVMELNPSFKTSKTEKEKHGFGMETIQRIVDDYQGSYFIWEEGKRLLQRITLKIREIEE